MPFIREILAYGSLSIVGLEKNTGKTECLNYILDRLPLDNVKVGVSSIGIDGERTDQVTRTAKPEIFLRDGMLFSTSEKHYRQKKILSELLEIGDEHTSLGRIITAKALSRGKVMLSGPPSTHSLIKWMKGLKADYGAELCIIDGALSRLSPASPAVSEAMILATGAALSITFTELVNKTLFVVKLININKCKKNIGIEITSKKSGVWLYNSKDNQYSALYDSAFTLNEENTSYKVKGDTVFVAGAITDRLLHKISQEKQLVQCEVVVRDFTKVFVTPKVYNSYIKSGGKISVLNKSKLIAICVNPVSPAGYTMDSGLLCKELFERTGVPTYDIFKHT